VFIILLKRQDFYRIYLRGISGDSMWTNNAILPRSVGRNSDIPHCNLHLLKKEFQSFVKFILL